MNMTEYLTTEQDKWHRRYNDAEIENDRLKRENESLKLAIHRLIMERDCAIKDMVFFVKDESLSNDKCGICALSDVPYGCFIDGKGCVYRWRGVKR